MSGRGWELTPEEVAAALEEAKARGLPDGWTVTLDVSLYLLCYIYTVYCILYTVYLAYISLTHSLISIHFSLSLFYFYFYFYFYSIIETQETQMDLSHWPYLRQHSQSLGHFRRIGIVARRYRDCQ